MRKCKVVLLILMLLLSKPMLGQFYKKLRYTAEGGILKSIGRESFAEYQSEVNPFHTFHYTKNKHYRLPSLRLRATAKYEVSSGWNAILGSGINVRYLEYNAYGEYTTIVSVPVTLGTELRLLKLGSKALFLGTGLGYNLMKIKTPPFEQRGGVTAAAEVSVQSNSFFYKLGYEYQQDNCSYDFDPSFRVVPGVWERIKYHENRHQLFVGIGLRF
jgi:hypothetical protein